MPKRDTDGRWKPGASGNPKGRPPSEKTLGRALERALLGALQDTGEEAIRARLSEMLSNPNLKPVDVSLLKLVVDRVEAMRRIGSDEGTVLEKLVAMVAERAPEQIAQFEWSNPELVQTRLDNLFAQLREQGTSAYAGMARALIDALIRDPRWRGELRRALKEFGSEPESFNRDVCCAYGSGPRPAEDEVPAEPVVEDEPAEASPDPRTVDPETGEPYPFGGDKHGRKIH